MSTVIVASHNPVKMNATKEGFLSMLPSENFEYESTAVASGVADQPTSSAETLLGAQTRAQNAKASSPNADYWVGIEGGLNLSEDELEVFAWVVILGKDGTQGRGRSASFFLPERIAHLIREGKELGEAASIVFKEDNVGQKQGTIGILTNNHIDRTKYYVDAVIIALIPFRNPEFYM